MTTTTSPQQLTLLPQPDVPVRFRLDEATVRRGRRHIAEIRRLLQEQPTLDVDGTSPVPPRQHAA